MGGEGSSESFGGKSAEKPTVVLLAQKEKSRTVEERFFDLSKKELIKLVLQNEVVRAGLVAEGNFLNCKTKNLVDLVINHKEMIAGLEQEAQLQEGAWKVVNHNLEKRHKEVVLELSQKNQLKEEQLKKKVNDLEINRDRLDSEITELSQSIENKNKALGEKSREIRELKKGLLENEKLIAQICQQFENYSPQRSRDGLVKKLEVIFNLINRFEVEKGRGPKEKKLAKEK